ncbi:MAG: hypothetical protein MJZ22_05765, partial [Candidatus Saccharibacteria bacterium]|nr:hypothetical protein [Candidatus Saccharibacteria bacterium]
SWAPANDVFVRYDNFVVSTDSLPVAIVKPGESGEDVVSPEDGSSAIKPALPNNRDGSRVGDYVGKRSAKRPGETPKYFKNEKDFNAKGQQQ